MTQWPKLHRPMQFDVQCRSVKAYCTFNNMEIQHNILTSKATLCLFSDLPQYCNVLNDCEDMFLGTGLRLNFQSRMLFQDQQNICWYRNMSYLTKSRWPVVYIRLPHLGASFICFISRCFRLLSLKHYNFAQNPHFRQVSRCRQHWCTEAASGSSLSLCSDITSAREVETGNKLLTWLLHKHASRSCLSLL